MQHDSNQNWIHSVHGRHQLNTRFCEYSKPVSALSETGYLSLSGRSTNTFKFTCAMCACKFTGAGLCWYGCAYALRIICIAFTGWNLDSCWSAGLVIQRAICLPHAICMLPYLSAPWHISLEPRNYTHTVFWGAPPDPPTYVGGLRPPTPPLCRPPASPIIGYLRRSLLKNQ